MIKLSETQEFYALYFHNKGASYSKGINNNEEFEWKRVLCARWRMLMNYFCLYKWNVAVNALAEGYDAYGILQRTNFKPHFSGNFWWTKSSVIRKAQMIDDCYTMDRYNAEFWLLDQSNLKIYSPYKRGLLLKVKYENNNYKLLPWWHLSNILFAIIGMTFAI